MPSLKARMFIFALRHSHLLRFQWKRRSTIGWDTSIPKLRMETEKSAGLLGKLPKEVNVSPVSIGSMSAEWLTLPESTKDKVILYFHGGGYVIGSSKAHLPIVAKFVCGSKIGALVFDYRLAPEHPYPAALDDSLAAYQWLLDQGVLPSDITFIGDSAGGGLCLAALIAIRDKGMPLPSAAVALSPWTDLANTGESLTTNAQRDTLTWAESWTIFSSYYVKENDPRLPYISPLYDDMHGLPPMQIYVGADELLRDDSTRFAQKAKAAGVDVTLQIGEGMFHCYPACSPLFPEAREAMDNICAFVRSHTGRALVR